MDLRGLIQVNEERKKERKRKKERIKRKKELSRKCCIYRPENHLK